jgi:hypothetical protein
MGRMQTVDPQAAYGEALRRATAPPAMMPRRAREMADALGMGLSFREPISRVPQMGRRERAGGQPPPSLWGALTDPATWKTVLKEFQRIQKQDAKRDPLNALYLDRTGRHKEAAAALAAMESTPRGAAERAFQENLGASGGSVAGAGTGLGLAARMRLRNPYAVGAMALGGGLLGAKGVADLQRLGRQALFSPEANRAYEALMARDQAQQPVASLVGELVASMPFFAPSGAAKTPGLFRQAAGGAALGAGMETGAQGLQIATGERKTWDPLRIAGQGAGGAIPTRQTALGAGAHRVGDWAGQRIGAAGERAAMSQTFGVGLGGAQGKPDNPNEPQFVQGKPVSRPYQEPSDRVIHGEFDTLLEGAYQTKLANAQHALRQHTTSDKAINEALSLAVFGEQFQEIVRRATKGRAEVLHASPGYGYYDDPQEGLQFNHNYTLITTGDTVAVHQVADAIGRATDQKGMLVVRLGRGRGPLPKNTKETISVLFDLPQNISAEKYRELSEALSSDHRLTVRTSSGEIERLFAGNTFFTREDGRPVFYTNSYYSSVSPDDFAKAIRTHRDIINDHFQQAGIPFSMQEMKSVAYAYDVSTAKGANTNNGNPSSLESADRRANAGAKAETARPTRTQGASDGRRDQSTLLSGGVQRRQRVSAGGALEKRLRSHITDVLQQAVQDPQKFLRQYGSQANTN